MKKLFILTVLLLITFMLLVGYDIEESNTLDNIFEKLSEYNGFQEFAIYRNGNIEVWYEYPDKCELFEFDSIEEFLNWLKTKEQI